MAISIFLMNPIVPFYQKHADALFSVLTDKSSDMGREHLERLTESLRAISVLLKVLKYLHEAYLPQTCHRRKLLQLLEHAEHSGDMYMQADNLEKNAEASGMDLDYLQQYALRLATQNLDELKTYLADFDISYWREYGEWLIESVREDDPAAAIQQIGAYTLVKVKKSLKRLKKKKPGAGNYLKLRRKLIVLGFLLEMLRYEKHHYGDLQQRLMEDSRSLEVWYSQWVGLKTIGHYKKDHPELACRYNGTLEILKDYMQQKISSV